MPSLQDNDHQQGTQSALILLMEYGYYQCLRSGQAYFTIQNIQTQFGDQLCFIYRHFPPDNREIAWKAAEAAEAAATQGKFWEMHQALFEHDENLGDSDLVEYAQQLNLDIPQFLREMTDHHHRDHIRAHKNSGIAMGVEQTPTFFISIRHDGYQKLDLLLQKIVGAINSD